MGDQQFHYIPQAVDAAAQKLHYNFSGVDKPKDKDGLYGLRYGDFVVPLVKAVQELSKQNDSLKNNNQNLSSKLDAVEEEVKQLKTSMLQLQQTQQRCSPCSAAITTGSVQQYHVNFSDAVSLEQNIPNPFNGTTSIGYYLPSNNSTAFINFYASSGALLKSVKLDSKGTGTINVKASELPSGVYQYALVIDGKVVDRKQMVQSK